MKNFRLFLSTMCLFIVFSLSFPQVSNAGMNVTFVVPEALTDTAGNISIPAVFPCFPAPSLRAQGVYLGSEIGFGDIVSIVNRIEPFGSGFGPTVIPDITVILSTTSAAPGMLSETFADNIGPDATVVFQGDVTLTTPDCNTSPCPFNAGEVEFQQPFIFDPSDGNLLVDITIPMCVPGITNADATDQFPNILSSVSAVPSDSPIGIASNVALVTQFTVNRRVSGRVANVPAMSGWGMTAAAAGLALIGYIVIRRRKATS